MAVRLLSAIALIALVGCATIAQDDSYAYGQPSDLKGLTKLYVDTGPDFKSRRSILKNIEKAKLGLEVVDDTENADILLSFGSSETFRRVITAGVITRALADAEGTGYVVANARGKLRIVHSFHDVKQSGWEREPVDNFSREFIKLYKKANDIK